TVEQSFKDARPEDFDALFIPGGGSPDKLRAHEEAVKFVKAFMTAGKPVLAICHGPQLLLTADEFKSHKMTAWKTIQGDLKKAGVKINEGADPDVARDIESHLGEMVPKEAVFQHAEGNSDSHIKTVLIGPSCEAPVRQGKLALGRWQAIFLCEWDGPRTRQVEVAVSPV